MKSGPKPKRTCSKGHDISLLGRTKSGNCKQCNTNYYKERWDFIRKQFKNKETP